MTISTCQHEAFLFCSMAALHWRTAECWKATR